MGAALKFRLTAPRPVLRESHVVRQCRDWLLAKGWVPRRQHVGTFKTSNGSWVTIGEAGDPDYLCVHRCYPAFFWECKRPGRKPTEVQVRRQRELTEGYRIPVVTADSLDSLIAFVNDHQARWS